MSVHVRYEVWVGDLRLGVQQCSPPVIRWRFNACFDTRQRAEEEVDWYVKHGYAHVEVRIRTTRYQRREHITTGGTDV